jgi:hypothetical protein
MGAGSIQSIQGNETSIRRNSIRTGLTFTGGDNVTTILKYTLVAIVVCAAGASGAVGGRKYYERPWDKTWTCNYIVAAGPKKGSEGWLAISTSEIKKGHFRLEYYDDLEPTSVTSFYFIIEGQDAYLNGELCQNPIEKK